MKNPISKRSLGLLTFILASWLNISMAAEKAPILIVNTPSSEVDNDPRFKEYFELLELALKASEKKFGKFELQKSKLKMTESRYLKELESGTIDVAVSSTSEEKELLFIPIRVPLSKGLLSYRVSFTNDKTQEKINKNLDNLKLTDFTIGQGIGWGDSNVYKASSMRLSERPYAELFRDISTNSLDLFPRGISEIFEEYTFYSKKIPELKIEQKILIYYPWPYYFFVNKKQVELAKRLEFGFQILVENGSFDRVFLKHNSKSIDYINSSKRKIIYLTNPLLPKNTPIKNKKLWFQPKWLKSPPTDPIH